MAYHIAITSHPLGIQAWETPATRFMFISFPLSSKLTNHQSIQVQNLKEWWSKHRPKSIKLQCIADLPTDRVARYDITGEVIALKTV
jgi:hypothetical protein